MGRKGDRRICFEKIRVLAALYHVPRRARIIVPGVAHHVTQRGNNRRAVFLPVEDRRLYLDLLGHHAARCGAHILGYCLMGNHVHLIAVPELENSLALTFGRAHSEYAQALNQAESWSGHVWQRRFFSCPLDEYHVMRAMRYAELNPVRAGLVAQPWDWPWSSARAHTEEHAMDAVLDFRWEAHFGRWDRREWRESLLSGVPDEECEALRKATATGAPLGSQEFVEGLERQAGRRRKEDAATGGGVQGCLFAD
jgi:putative transposase